MRSEKEIKGIYDILKTISNMDKYKNNNFIKGELNAFEVVLEISDYTLDNIKYINMESSLKSIKLYCSSMLKIANNINKPELLNIIKYVNKGLNIKNNNCPVCDSSDIDIQGNTIDNVKDCKCLKCGLEFKSYPVSD